MNVVTRDSSKKPVVPVIQRYQDGELETILTNLDAVTMAITIRYGIHPEGDATEAAAVVIRNLISEK